MSPRTAEHRRPLVAKPTSIQTRQATERALLVGVAVRGKNQPWELRDSLDELAQLARTAGAQVACTLSQQLPRLTRTYVGQGKLVEIQEKVREFNCTLVIVDDELKPSQQRNMEEALQGDEAHPVKVIDRTALIIDIFGQRARTQEGRLQVELAQSQYLLPRLVGQWSHLERLGAGIGTRGPGESQLETDRRLVTERIQKLKKRLEDVRRRRSQYWERRKTSGTPVVALVGYTNAGKSTLFNVLSKSAVKVEDRLFSTLDPTTRQVRLSDGRPIFLSDTVGFIHKLPALLVAAFRATLEELEGADLLLHVVDISHHNAAGQVRVVDETLAELDLAEKPRLLVLNKLDLLMDEEAASAPDSLVLDGIQPPGAPPVGVSATKEWGLHRLLQAIAESCPANDVRLPSGNSRSTRFAPEDEASPAGPV
ncbi:MAG: GTPase HflX [Dehalococcoidia bacterium]|nr:GTPase HflX [Dehalococcoidia bacterium]